MSYIGTDGPQIAREAGHLSWHQALGEALRFPPERSATMLVVAALCLTLFDLALYQIDPLAHWRFCAEDGLVENLTVVFWLVGGVYILSTLKHRRARWLFVVLAIMAIWVAGEEISWGQRLFNIATPAGLSGINEQHEFNMHNIEGVHENIKWIGLTLILFGSVALPFMQVMSRTLRNLFARFGFPFVRLDAIAMVILSVSLMAVPRALGMDNVFDETGEMIMGLAFMLFALDTSGFVEPTRRRA